MAARLIRAAGLAMLATTACIVDIDFGSTRFKCSGSSDCPSGQACVNGYCEAPGSDDAAVWDAAPPMFDATPVLPDAGPPADPRIGDPLFYSFDRRLGRDLAEESGHRFDGYLQGTVDPAIAAVHGSALDFDVGYVWVPKDPAIAIGPPLTIEAWVRRDLADVAEAVIGDRDPASSPYATYDLLLEASPGGATFTTNDGCADTEVAVTAASADVPAGVWKHVAVTWDGQVVKFYLDGTRVANVPLVAKPCAAPGSHFRIGRRNDGTAPFHGEIDEVKVSSYVKSRAQIEASMMFDASAADAVCGDRLHDTGETCDLETDCCDPSTCQLATGPACGDGTCQSGVCVAGGGRVTDGLIAFYTFDDGAGTTVADSSGVDPALDLVIADELAVTWQSGALTIDTSTQIASTVPAAKLVTACQLTGELTLEAWVEPANLTQAGPARLLTMSLDQSNRNFQLGQVEDRYQARVRTSLTTLNGTPDINSPIGSATTALTHVVATRDASGKRVIYVNGMALDSNQVAGDFDGWDSTYGLSLANEFAVDRTWLGTYHLVAIYDRALTVGEVGRNFTAGAD